jgi:hypothetical protein
MPNWCSNSLFVCGDKETIALIERKLENANKKINVVENLIKQKDEVLRQLVNPDDIERIAFEFDAKIRVAKEIEMNEDTDNVGCFKTLIGIPDTITNAEYRLNSYDTNVSYYGTKWDIDYAEFQWDFDEESINVNFETAWSPPTGFVEKLVLQYKGITSAELLYEECGCNFAGRMVVERDSEGNVSAVDNCLQYEEGIYEYQTDYFWDRLYDEIRCAIEECDNDKSDLMTRYAFVDAEDLKEIENTIDEIILELQTEKNEQEA